MKLFIDGDALPKLLKPVLYRAIVKHSIETVVVANKRIDLGKFDKITNIQVAANPDEADNQIVEMVGENDLVITADIQLADFVLKKKAFALDHRGKVFDADNIANFLTMRELMKDIRDSGEIIKGQSSFSQKDVHKFANQLNKFLQRLNS